MSSSQAMSSRVHIGKKVELNEDDEAEAPKSLEERLSNYREPIRKPFIHKIPIFCLRGTNDNAHEPIMVAIGPYHHGKQRLKMMEQHKLRYLLSLLRKNESVGRYLSAVAEIQEEARSCYAEDLSHLSSDEFIEMLVLDGCFIIKLLLESHNYFSLDPLFDMEWFLDLLRKDLMLFENQMPFFVLCKLFDLIHDKEEPNNQEKLVGSIFHFLKLGPYNGNLKPEDVRHLLHLTHATLRPSSSIFIKRKWCLSQREYQLIPSATMLKDSNITFRKREGDTSNILYEVDFSNGVLTMSTLAIHDGTDRYLRNLVMYEQYFPDLRPTYVTDYVVMLDFLVNTGRDVEILSECGIIDNLTGDNQVAADIINRLAQSAMVSQTYFIYADTFKHINAHHRRPWNRARASLNRDYFNTPWSYISFFAAVLLLLLTVAQTIISAIQL